MKRLSKTLLYCATFLLGLMPLQASFATGYPDKPVTLIVPYPAGGGADTIGRMVSQVLGEHFDVPFTVLNVPGAGTIIGAQSLLKAKPDGYTLMLAPNNQLTMLPALHEKLPFDPATSFDYITTVATIYYAMAVPNDSPITTLQELIDMAKSQPGVLNYSSCGPGSGCNVAAEYFKSLTQTDITHIPYQGTAPATAALLGSQVDVAFDTATGLAPLINAGKIKGLAIPENERLPFLADVPTVVEAGTPEFIFNTWQGLVAPQGTPEHVIQTINSAWQQLSKEESTKKMFADRGIGIRASTPEAYKEDVLADVIKWGKVIKEAGIVIN